METILSGIGVGGGALTACFVIWSVARRLLTSKCVRGADGSPHLEVGLRFSQDQLAAIENDPHLKEMFGQLSAKLDEAVAAGGRRASGESKTAEP